MWMGISFFTREPDSPSFMGFTCSVRTLTPSTTTCIFFLSIESSLPTVPCQIFEQQTGEEWVGGEQEDVEASKSPCE